MKHAVYFFLLFVFLVLPFAGCATQTRYVEPEGTDTLNTEEINIQDFSIAAEKLINSLLASGKLDRGTEQPAILAISRITNNTSQQFDTDLLIKKIRVALNKSGQAATTTTMGLGGIAEDPLAEGLQQEREFYTDKEEPRRLPDFTLSGKVIEKRERKDEERQYSYSFQLSLTDVITGNTEWGDEKTITKRSKRGTIGW